MYSTDYDDYIVPGAETHNSPFYPNGYIGTIDWSLPWNADTFWSALIYPYVKNGTLVGSEQWGNNGESLRVLGGIFNCPDFPRPTQSDEYGPHSYLSPSFNNGGVIDWNYPNGAAAITPPVQSFSGINAPADAVILIEKGSCGPTTDHSNEVFWGGESYWTTGVGATGANDNSDLVEINGDCDWPWDWGHEPNGSWAPTSCNSLPRFRHNKATCAGFSDGHAKTKTVGGFLWYKNIYQPNSMAVPY
jgi:hypothetical protein